MTYFNKRKLAEFIGRETMDEDIKEDKNACNCGENHGTDDKNIAPSMVEGDEKASGKPKVLDDKSDDKNGMKIAQDKADKYLKQCAEDGVMGRLARAAKSGWNAAKEDSGVRGS